MKYRLCSWKKGGTKKYKYIVACYDDYIEDITFEVYATSKVLCSYKNIYKYEEPTEFITEKSRKLLANYLYNKLLENLINNKDIQIGNLVKTVNKLKIRKKEKRFSLCENCDGAGCENCNNSGFVEQIKIKEKQINESLWNDVCIGTIGIVADSCSNFLIKSNDFEFKAKQNEIKKIFNIDTEEIRVIAEVLSYQCNFGIIHPEFTKEHKNWARKYYKKGV